MALTIARVQATLESQVQVIRGRRVVLDIALANLYGVTTRSLNQAVKRNRSRFPFEFAFQLSPEEFESLRSQTVTSNVGRGGRRWRPWVFTEHGAIMAASVLNSRRAVDMSIYVVRAFIRLREAATGHAELLAKLQVIERTVGRHDTELKEVFEVLRRTLAPPRAPSRRIGFRLPSKA